MGNPAPAPYFRYVFRSPEFFRIPSESCFSDGMFFVFYIFIINLHLKNMGTCGMMIKNPF